MSPTYISGVVNILAVLLPLIGVKIGSEELTTTLSTIVAIATALVVIVRRYKKGDVNILGGIKQIQ